MRNLTLLLLFIILFSACRDDEEPFRYTDVTPDKTVTSMIQFPWTWDDISSNNIWFTINEDHDGIVWCAWSGLSYDMDMDGEADVGFQVKHMFESVDEEQTYDEFLIYITSLYGTEISLDAATDGYVKRYSYGDALDYDSFGKSSIRFQVEEGGYLVRIDLHHNLEAEGEFYVGVRKIIDNRAYYGWFLVETVSHPIKLTVKEYAISRIGDREITIGQR